MGNEEPENLRAVLYDNFDLPGFGAEADPEKPFPALTPYDHRDVLGRYLHKDGELFTLLRDHTEKCNGKRRVPNPSEDILGFKVDESCQIKPRRTSDDIKRCWKHQDMALECRNYEAVRQMNKTWGSYVAWRSPAPSKRRRARPPNRSRN